MAATKIYDKHKAGPDQIRSDPDDRYTHMRSKSALQLIDNKLETLPWTNIRQLSGKHHVDDVVFGIIIDILNSFIREINC